MHITINNLSKTIKGRVVLDDIRLEMQSGRIYGFRGINGSGKTMLMRAICGLIRPSSGTIEIDGAVLGKDLSFPKSVGALIENPAFISKYTGLENLRLLAMIRGVATKQELKDTLTSVGLDPMDKRSYKKYSLGMRQRLGMAAACIENPELILLDEPFNALDESGIDGIRDLILKKKGEGALLIVACHDTQELISMADEVIEMYEGKITKCYEVKHDESA